MKSLLRTVIFIVIISNSLANGLESFYNSSWYRECPVDNRYLCGFRYYNVDEWLDYANCRCDALCPKYGDCCSDWLPQPLNTPVKGDYDEDYYQKIECLPLPTSSDRNFGIFMVAKCDPVWREYSVKERCESELKEGQNVTDAVPVFSVVSEKFYKNAFCAVCNNDGRFLTTWTLENVECLSVKSSINFNIGFVVENCAWQVREFNDLEDFYRRFKSRTCAAGAISTCDPPGKGCDRHRAPIVFKTPTGPRIYLNYDCAKCNGIDEESDYTLDCERYQTVYQNFQFSKRQSFCWECERDLGTCRDCHQGGHHLDEIRKILNMTEDDVVRGRQMKVSAYRLPSVHYNTSTSTDRRVASKISSMRYVNNYLTTSGHSINVTQPHERSDTVGISISTYQSSKRRVNKTLVISPWGKKLNPEQYELFVDADGKLILHWAAKDWVEATYINSDYDTITTMHIVCHALSVTSLCIQLIAYSILPSLRNLPGKIVMSISASLASGNLVFVISYYLKHNFGLCYFFGVFQHYAYLAVFFWTNVLAIIVTRTFAKSNGCRSYVESKGKYFKYSLYAWITPGMLVLVAILMDSLMDESQQLKPNYGRGLCFMTQKWPRILFSSGPIAALLFCNAVLFVVTARNWYLTAKDTRVVNKESFQLFFVLSVKLAVILGLSWVFGFVAVVSEVPEIFHPFVMITELQGVFLFVALTCRAEIWRLLTQKYPNWFDRSSDPKE